MKTLIPHFFVCAVILAIAGCDASIYQPIATKDGSVVVVNKLTGNAAIIEDAHIVALTEHRQKPVAIVSPNLQQLTIPDVPVAISSRIKFRDTDLLLRVFVMPKEKMSDPEWVRWRSYIHDARGTARITAEFEDADGFDVTTASISLSDMTKIVGADGEFASLEYQGSIPISETKYSDIASWSISWVGWPTFTPIEDKRP